MILSARFVKNPTSDNLLMCEHCYWPIHGEHIRLYGMAHKHEKPYTLRFHVDCIKKNTILQDQKIEKALKKAYG